MCFSAGASGLTAPAATAGPSAASSKRGWRRPTQSSTTRTTANTTCSTATITTSSRAASRSRCGICRAARRRSTTTTIRSPTGRAANPRWFDGIMRHGYKGAAEIAATVDYLFAFAATTRAVDDAHFDLLHDAYLGDAAVHD